MPEEYVNDPGLLDESELIPAEPEDSDDNAAADDADEEATAAKDSDGSGDGSGEAEEGVADDAQGDSEGDGSGDNEAESEASKEEEGEEDSEGDADTPPEITDETTVELGEETVTVAELKEAYEIKEQAVEKLTEANTKIEEVEKVAAHIKAHPIETLLHIFGQVFEGDRQRAHDHVLGLCEKVVAKHMEYESKSESEKEAIRKGQEADELRKKLEAKEAEEKRQTEAAEQIALAEKFTKDIKAALTAEEMEPSARALGAVSDILLRASQANLKNVTTAAAVKKYKTLLAQQEQELIENLDYDKLPEKVRAKLAKKNIEKVKKSRSAKKTSKSERKEKPGDYKVVSQEEWDSIGM